MKKCDFPKSSIRKIPNILAASKTLDTFIVSQNKNLDEA